MGETNRGRDERTSSRLILSGRVQGVGFRYWARGEARRLNLRGWVRNRSDGSVEVSVEGPKDDVQRFRDRLSRGPSPARVDETEDRGHARDLPDEGFEIRP